MSILPPDVRALYPFKRHYLEMRGPRMHYVDEGEGPAVVMLHGNPTWSFFYRNLILGLRDDYRTIAPDHIGCGLSDKPQRYPYGLATHIDNLERLSDHLRLEKVTLAVHDWGGAIGFGWAIRQPQRVKRLVILNTAAFRGPVPFRIRVCRWPVVGTAALLYLNAFARGALSMATVHPQKLTPAIRRGYLFPYQSRADRFGILRFVQDIPITSRSASRPVLQSIENGLHQFRDRPAILFWGARDFCFHDWFLDRWKTLLPSATVHRFPDAGHYVLEDAFEEIMPRMREFLARTAVVSPRMVAP